MARALATPNERMTRSTCYRAGAKEEQCRHGSLTVSRVRPSCSAQSLCYHRRPLSDLLFVPAPPCSSLCVGSWGADAELAGTGCDPAAVAAAAAVSAWLHLHLTALLHTKLNPTSQHKLPAPSSAKNMTMRCE